MGHNRRGYAALLLAFGAAFCACRRSDTTTTTPVVVGSNGEPGTGSKAQCSGWFPDWISNNPPADSVQSFQLAQGYPLGTPVLEAQEGKLRVVRWDPPAPATTAAEAPWLAHDFRIASERAAYLESLKQYFLEGNDSVDFAVQRNSARAWFHVPMMTSDAFSRREPYHGLTKERQLRSRDHKWIVDGTDGAGNLNAYAIGAYNWLGGYTIGQVFRDPDPQLSDPTQAHFIVGAYVFKLLFAEYDPTKIVTAQDPLIGAPEWQVQDIQDPAGHALRNVRLLQVDVAVRDDRSTQTGWVFATFVYDKSMTTGSNPWRRLRAVGVMWGNDPDVTSAGVGTLDETWTAAGLPSDLARQDGRPYGRDGRLNGPVDNPFSSCLSCHSTAQVVVGASTRNAFRGVDLFPPPPSSSCASPMMWFRNVNAGVPFGVTTNGGDGCELASPPTPTPPLHSLDYSLQLADALQSALFDRDPNPCAALAAQLTQTNTAAPAATLEESQRKLAPHALREPTLLERKGVVAGVSRSQAPTPTRVAVKPTAVNTRTEPNDGPHRR